MKLYHPTVILDIIYDLMYIYIYILQKSGVTRIMYNSPNRGVNDHIL